MSEGADGVHFALPSQSYIHSLIHSFIHTHSLSHTLSHTHTHSLSFSLKLIHSLIYLSPTRCTSHALLRRVENTISSSESKHRTETAPCIEDRCVTAAIAPPSPAVLCDAALCSVMLCCVMLGWDGYSSHCNTTPYYMHDKHESGLHYIHNAVDDDDVDGVPVPLSPPTDSR